MWFYESHIRKGLPLEIYQLVADFQAVMDHYNIPFFFSSGTLLGAVRHGGLIPWDDDADCCVLEENFEKFISITPVLNRLGYATPLLNGLGYVTYPEEYKWVGYKVYKPGKACLDVFMMSPQNDLYVYPSGWPHMKLTKEKIYPLRKIKFGSVAISVPRDIKDFLTQNFGEGWATVGQKYNHFSLVHTETCPEEILNPREFLPAGPFGPLVDNLAKISEPFELDVNASDIFEYMRRAPSERTSYPTKNAKITLLSGFDAVETEIKGRWLTNGEASLIFKPKQSAHAYFVKLMGYTYRPDDSNEWNVQCYDNEKLIDAEIDDEGLGFFLFGNTERTIKLKMSQDSPSNYGSTDSRNLSFFLKKIQVYGGNAL